MEKQQMFIKFSYDLGIKGFWFIVWKKTGEKNVMDGEEHEKSGLEVE